MSQLPAKRAARESLLADNPMMAEVGRNIRRLVGQNLTPQARQAGLIGIPIVYLFILYLVIRTHGGGGEIAILILQAISSCFFVPAVTHGAIVGEREKRSWDILLVSPVTPRQIVVAKFMTGATLVGVVAALSFPLAAISWIGSDRPFLGVVYAEIATVTFGLALNAFALAVSARSKRTLHAQTTIYGAAAGFLALWPMVVSLLTGGRNELIVLLNLLNPFFLIVYLLSGDLANTAIATATGWQIPAYILAMFFFLWRARKSVERDVQELE